MPLRWNGQTEHHGAQQPRSPAGHVACCRGCDGARALGHDGPGDQAGGEAKSEHLVGGHLWLQEDEPTGMEAPPTIVPRTVRSQVKFMVVAVGGRCQLSSSRSIRTKNLESRARIDMYVGRRDLGSED